MTLKRDTHINHNYRIGTDVLADGRVRAKAHGRKTNTQTFPVGTTPEEAAQSLANKLEGNRPAWVRMVSSDGANRADWEILVSNGAGE